MGGAARLWTTAAAAPDAPPARPDPGDPVIVAVASGLAVFPAGSRRSGERGAPAGPRSVVRPSRAPPTGGDTPYPRDVLRDAPAFRSRVSKENHRDELRGISVDQP